MSYISGKKSCRAKGKHTHMSRGMFQCAVHGKEKLIMLPSRLRAQTKALTPQLLVKTPPMMVTPP